jgi:signal peptidase I
LRNPIDRLTVGLPRNLRITIDWLVTILGAIVIVLAIKQWVINPYRIPSSSMEPTLHCAKPGDGCLAPGGLLDGSDRVLACRFCYDIWAPKRGDIVVFNTPPKAAEVCGTGGVFVKRLIGLPGDVWAEKDGYVYIDGKRLNEPYIKPQYRDTQTIDLAQVLRQLGETPTARIPPGMYLMMGDNRKGSCDSRKWGLVPRKNLIGRVVATYWPPSRVSIQAIFAAL